MIPINTYDQVPYSSYPYAQSHPQRLATIATLLGLSPMPLEQCRVLELGCCSGGNLIPMAEQLPESHFVGLDASARQVAAGQAAVDALGHRPQESAANTNEALPVLALVVARGRGTGLDFPRHGSGVRKLSGCRQEACELSPAGLRALGAPSARLFLVGLLPGRARLRFTGRKAWQPAGIAPTTPSDAGAMPPKSMLDCQTAPPAYAKSG